MKIILKFQKDSSKKGNLKKLSKITIENQKRIENIRFIESI